MEVSNHYDIIMEKKGGASTLLHAIVSICQGTKNGGKLLIQNSWVSTTFSLHFITSKLWGQ